MLPNDLSLIFMGMKQEKGMDEYVPVELKMRNSLKSICF
jgi:hypothetical protein